MTTRKAVFFSTDALVALLLVFLVVLIAIPFTKQSKSESKIEQDLITTLSSLKVGEIDNVYVQDLITQGIITNTDNTLLEQLGEFYVTNKSLAETMSGELLKDLTTNENIGIWFENTLIASKNYSPIEEAKQIDTARQIVSGIQAGENITGYSARAFLTSSLQSKYFYFGGYIGNGNLTANIEYSGNITSSELEIAVNNDFDLYVNGEFAGQYQKSVDDLTPSKYSIPVESFNSGVNTLSIQGTNLYIAGGFLKLSYEASESYSQIEKQNIPGVTGLINIYDGLTLPENFDSLDISLHLDSNYTVFMTLGNKTIFSGQTEGEETITLSDNELSTILDYERLSGKTTPFRIGLENVSYVINFSSKADVFSVTDISGSMADSCNSNPKFWCCLFSGNYCRSEQTCTACGGVWTEKISLAKEANNLLIDTLLNYTENKVGLVGYRDIASDNDYHALSDNADSLKSKVSSWSANGETCVCCGINKANQGFQGSSSDRQKAMIVLSDGIANRQCPQQNTGDAKQDAILAACQTFDNYNITVHAVGFGQNADEATLQSIASCGNGSYYFADVNDIVELYEEIANDIIEGFYREQTIELEGNITTKIFADSFIQYGYNSTVNPFGLIITSEKKFDDANKGQFSIPYNSTVLEAFAISYSGSKWTKNVILNNASFYNLTLFGKNYTELGDPYSIKIPNGYILENNLVEITTGTSHENSTSGSEYNKIIYTIFKNASAFSPIATQAEGCIWKIEFENGENITTAVPSDYAGEEECSYTSQNVYYNINDAIQTAVYLLLKQLDLNLNQKIDLQFTEQDLQIDFSEIQGIPFPWSTEIQVRKWI